ncbi:DUF4347 domain-containing protein [Dyadobacter sp. CY107]|uniref:DUF4347 domain-containing protein n=1 Tax=Dyadobacter fanqingshengii TaxID=2906443 RepID=UPI001F31AC07|nr:DUF4347 domain-containing protein [Dyadobacter fanqingshengii]MCF2502605.1 DUF4347 domain-containing protein [Dyadobacter fanqingshengii]
MMKTTFTLYLCLLSLLTFSIVCYKKLRSSSTGDLVIIDESLKDYRSLADGLDPKSQVIYVSNSPEGLQNLTKQLASRGKAERVHIMTHGTDGNFVLGQTQLNNANFSEHESFWQSLGNVLVAGRSSLLIYSCQLTASRTGEQFVQRLHSMLGVPVAASDDQTGSERRGGDWDLEYVAGKILRQHVLKLMDFNGLLVPTFTQLTGGSSPFNGMTIATDDQLIYGDFDADGDIDIHSYDGTSAINDFWQNNGSGSFAKVTGAASPFENVFENAVFYFALNAFVADWDNDGDDDIYVPMRNSGQNEKNFYYRNDNGKYVLLSGASSPFNGINVSGNNEMIIGDFDTDGDIDIHSYPGSQLDNEFWRNNGSGAFSKVTGEQNPFDNLSGKAAFSSARYAFLGDWDNDGDVDILVSRRGNTSVRDYHRNDNGIYTIQTGAANPFDGMAIANDNQIIFGDFDADGDIDLQTSDGSSTLVFWRNNGSGNFTQVTGAENPFNTLPNSGAFYNNALKSFVADWDNDGDVDVFTTNYTAANQKYFFRQNDAPPRITSTTPANVATGVSVSSNISLTFSRTVTGAAGKNIQIRRSDNNSVFADIPANSAQVTGGGSNTITIDPPTDLDGATGYYITIDEAAFVDSEGRIFEGVSNNATLRFTTGTPPTTVTSITPQDDNPTNSSSVAYEVVFAQSVTGVDASDFTLTSSDVSGAAVSGVSGSGTTYTVTINTGSGNGTIRLDFSGLTGTVPNVSAEFTTASAYTIYKVSNASDYYRSANVDANWNTVGDWISSADNSFWITATAIPGGAAASTLITTGQTMRMPTGLSLTVRNLTIDGTLHSGDSQFSVNGSCINNGTLTGSGTFIVAMFTNVGVLSPGESPGFPAFTNDMTTSGTLLMEIGGTERFMDYDIVQTFGFTAGGTLSVSFINGFTPKLGDAFTLVEAGNITGAFESVNLPDISPLVWETTSADGKFTIRAVNNPMPVTLVNFNASMNESAVDLVWSTSSEINSSHFEIQRSKEGKIWENIGLVNTRNENAGEQHYQYTDMLPLQAENFYRLRMVDADGTFAFSKIEHVRFLDSKAQLRSYPNPVTDRIFLDVTNVESIQSVEIYSASGVLHYTGGYSPEGIDVKALPSGIFLLKTIGANRTTSTFKFAKH